LVLSFRVFFEAALLALTLSTDVFVAFITYGGRDIRVPRLSALTAAFMCAVIFLLFGFIGRLLSQYFPDGVNMFLGFIILLVVGLIRIFDSAVKALIRRGLPHRRFKLRALGLSVLLEVYADPETADVDKRGDLSVRESALLAAAMSFDGAAAGFCAYAGGINIWIATVFSLVFSVAAIAAGLRLGKFLSGRCPIDTSFIGGILLIALAITKLF